MSLTSKLRTVKPSGFISRMIDCFGQKKTNTSAIFLNFDSKMISLQRFCSEILLMKKFKAALLWRGNMSLLMMSSNNTALKTLGSFSLKISWTPGSNILWTNLQAFSRSSSKSRSVNSWRGVIFSLQILKHGWILKTHQNWQLCVQFLSHQPEVGSPRGP